VSALVDARGRQEHAEATILLNLMPNNNLAPTLPSRAASVHCERGGYDMRGLTNIGGRVLGVALLSAALAVPAEAQKREERGRPAAERHAERPELVRQAPARDAAGRAQPKRDARGNGAGIVPPGWCIGRGNPHNTPANCGYADWRRDADGWRVGERRYRSFEEAHATFHRHHDLECRARLAERPLDPTWQIRTRADCRAQHERWHERNDPNWPRSRH
jgi:hypothetical protein